MWFVGSTGSVRAMDLHVVTSALRKYSSSLTAWSGDTAEATSYVSRNLRLEWSDAMMFQTVVQVNEGVVSAIKTRSPGSRR